MGNKAMEGDNDMLIIVVTYAQCTSGMFCVWKYTSKSIEQYCNTQSDYGWT